MSIKRKTIEELENKIKELDTQIFNSLICYFEKSIPLLEKGLSEEDFKEYCDNIATAITLIEEAREGKKEIKES